MRVFLLIESSELFLKCYLWFVLMEVVVVGARGFGKQHMRALEKLDVAVSVVERDQSVVEEIRSQFKLERVFSSVDDALSSSAEVMDLVLPHDLHAPVAERAMRKGKHVIVEKPMALNLQEADEMIRISKETGKKLMVADQWHFDPSIREARRLIGEGKIGRLVAVLVRSQGFYDAYGWRRSRAEMGGGALIDGGIHYVDTLLSLGGDYDSVWGIAVKGASVIEGEDTSAAVLRLANGALGLLFYSWSYRNPPSVPEFEAFGTDGSLAEDVQGSLKRDHNTVYRGLLLNGSPYAVKGYDPMVAEMEGFLKSVSEGTKVPFDPELAKRELELVLAVYGTDRASIICDDLLPARSARPRFGSRPPTRPPSVAKSIPPA